MLVLMRPNGATISIVSDADRAVSLKRVPALAVEIRRCHLKAARVAMARGDTLAMRRHMRAARIYAELLLDLTAAKRKELQ